MMEKMECRSPFTWIAIRDLASTTGDALQMARLKKRKLVLRDQIQWIEDKLTPDIIA